jgi:hypothetical protein
MINITNVEVELEPGFANYRLPLTPPSPEEAIEAIRRSWQCLLLAPSRVTAPLLAAAYAAPLSEIVVPDFTLWLWGATGSFKSTLAAHILSHFGDFSETNLPLSFESTSNALERNLFLAKDVVTVVDDWRPGVTRADSDDMDRKAQRLLRGVGNRQGRGRMTSDIRLRTSYPPRGVVVVTAEALPEGPAFQSAAARSLSINLSKEDVDLARLSDLQRDKQKLSMAMRDYISYVAERYEQLAKELPAQREVLRNRLQGKLPDSHPRTPDNAAALIVALEQLKNYSVSVGGLDKTEARERYKVARDGVLTAARAHTEATRGGDPASTFVEILRSLFAAKRAYVRDRESGNHPPNCLRMGWEDPEAAFESPDGFVRVTPTFRPATKAEFVGWADESFLCLDKEAAYAAVSGFAQRGGLPFGIKPKALWEAMSRSAMSLTDPGRNDTTAKIEGKTRRIIQIPRELVDDEDVVVDDEDVDL